MVRSVDGVYVPLCAYVLCVSAPCLIPPRRLRAAPAPMTELGAPVTVCICTAVHMPCMPSHCHVRAARCAWSPRAPASYPGRLSGRSRCASPMRARRRCPRCGFYAPNVVARAVACARLVFFYELLAAVAATTGAACLVPRNPRARLRHLLSGSRPAPKRSIAALCHLRVVNLRWTDRGWLVTATCSREREADHQDVCVRGLTLIWLHTYSISICAVSGSLLYKLPGSRWSGSSRYS